MNPEIVDMDRKYLPDALAVYEWYVENSTATFQISPASLAQMESLLFFDTPRYRSFAVLEHSSFEAIEHSSFAAVEPGSFAGYGIVTRYRSREAYDLTAEITVYLADRATGKGYGAQVVARLEDFARSQGLHVLVAQISGENVASCKLFERAGYAKCAHHHEVGLKFGRWLDLVCYEKIL